MGEEPKNEYELARIRTWNLLIRSQTRYPLRHKALDGESGDAKVFVMEHHPKNKIKKARSRQDSNLQSSDP